VNSALGKRRRYDGAQLYRNEGRPFEVGTGAGLKPPQAAVVKAMVVSIAEKLGQDSGW
jgi:hypothetical protein